MKRLSVFGIALIGVLLFSVPCFASGFFGGAGGGGTGDVTAVGDCASGDCLDGSSDGGTAISLYDGDSNKITIDTANMSGDLTLVLPNYDVTMPTSDGSSGQFIKTDGSGNWAFASAAGGGTVKVLKHDDSQVGDQDILTLDFGTGFTLTENPDTEMQITFDVTPDSGSATLEVTEDSIQVKFDITDFAEDGSLGLTLGASPTIATALLMGSDPAEAGTIRMPSAGSIVFEDTTEVVVTHVAGYGLSFNTDLEAADGNTDFIIRADNENADTLKLQAMNVGGSYTSLVTLTSHTTAPTLTLDSVGASAYVSSASTVTIESVVFTGAAVSSVSTLGTTDDISIVAADPDLVFTDSDHSADARIMVDSIDAHDVVMVLAVDDGSSDDNPYIELDGANDRVEMKVATLFDTTAEFDGIASFDANPAIWDGSHYLTFDADGLTSAATIKFGGDTNNLLIANGTATIDIAAGATLNLDKTLNVGTNAGTLNFTAGSKTLSVEDDAVVSQDYSSNAGPEFATIELGATDDTTLSRSGAGAIQIEGAQILLSGHTLTGDVGVTFDADGSTAAVIADSVAVSSWNLTTPTITSGAVFAGADVDPNTAGEVVYDDSISGILGGGGLRWYDDDSVRLIVDLETDPSDDDFVVTYDADNDLFYMKADKDTGGATEYQDIADPTADGSISFDNDEEAVYTSAAAAAGNDVFTFEATGAFGDISIVKITQNTGDPTDGTLLELISNDANVDELLIAADAGAYTIFNQAPAGGLTIDITSDGTPLLTIADEVSLTKVPAASAAMDVLTLSGTLAALDADDFTAILIDYDTSAAHATSGTIIMLEIDALDGDSEIDMYGIRIGNMANQAKIEQAIEIGTGWDCGIDFVDDTAVILHSGATSLSIESTGGTVIIDGATTFTGANVTSMGTLGVGKVTSTAAVESSGLFDVTGATSLTLGSADVTAWIFSGINEVITVTPSEDLVTVTTSTSVATFDFGTINLATDALDVSDGSITNVADIALDSISADATNVLFGNGATTQLQFRDALIYIHSANDGYLDLEADTGIRFNGPVTFVNQGAITLPISTNFADTAFTDLATGATYTFGDAGDDTVDELFDAIDTAIDALGGDITAVGDVASGAAFVATAGDDGATTLYFEGSTGDAHELALTTADIATADRTVTLRDATGTVLISGDSLTGHATATFDTDGSTATTVVDFALNADADAGDVDIKSVDGLYGVDDQIYLDMGTQGKAILAADTTVEILVSDEDITFADGGANLINVSTNSSTATVDFGTINLATDALDLSEGDISNVGVIKADELEPDAVANGSLIIQSGQTATNTLKLQAYDTDAGPATVDVITITSATAVTMAIDTSDWDIDATGAVSGVAIDEDTSDVRNLADASIAAAAAIDASKIADGSVSDAEFQRLDGVGADLTTSLTTQSIIASTSVDITGSTGLILENDETITNSDNGYVALSGHLVIPDAATIGSDTDKDAIAIASDGKTTFSQDMNLSEDLVIGDGKYIGSASAKTAMQISSGGIVTFIDDILLKDDGTIGSASATSAMTIDSSGIVAFVDDILIKDTGTIGSASDPNAISISSAGVIDITNVTEASAIGTAALTVDGGLGVAKDVWIGDDLVLDSDSAVLKFGTDQDVTLTHTNDVGLDINLAFGILDDQTLILGTNDDWTVMYDETTNDRLEFLNIQGTSGDSDVHWDLDDNGADATFTIENTDATYEANLVVVGNISSTSTDESFLQLTTNDAISPSGNRIYVELNEWKVSENGAEEVLLTQEDGATLTGTSWSFLGVTNMVLPSAAADASGEISMSTGNELIWHDGTKVITIDTTPTNDNYVLKYDNASATFTLEADETGGTPAWNAVTAPTADVNLIHDAGEETQFTYTGNFTTGVQFNVEQLTGNPSGGILFQVKGADSDITLARLGDGTNYTQISQAGNLTLAGTALITAGGIILGDSTPDAAGEVGFATNAFKFFGANSEDLSINVGTASDTCTITSNTSVATLDIQIATLTVDDISASGSITAVVGVDASGTISANLFAPDGQGGADIGSTALEFNDLFLDDAGKIQLGDDQDVTITHVADVGITMASVAPDLTLVDNTAGDGTGNLLFSTTNGGSDIVATLQADIANTATTFISLDGSAEEVLFGKKIDIASLGIENCGAIGDDAAIGIVSSGSTVTIESVVFTAGALTGVTSITQTAADNPYVLLDEDDDADVYIMNDDVGEEVEFSIDSTIGQNVFFTAHMDGSAYSIGDGGDDNITLTFDNDDTDGVITRQADEKTWQFSNIMAVTPQTYDASDEDDVDITLGTEITSSIIFITGDNDTDNEELDLQDGVIDGQMVTFVAGTNVDANDTVTIDVTSDTVCQGCGAVVLDLAGDVFTLVWMGSAGTPTWAIMSSYDAS